MPFYEDDVVDSSVEVEAYPVMKGLLIAEEDEEELVEGRSLWEVGFEKGEQQAREEVFSEEGDWYE